MTDANKNYGNWWGDDWLSDRDWKASEGHKEVVGG